MKSLKLDLNLTEDLYNELQKLKTPEISMEQIVLGALGNEVFFRNLPKQGKKLLTEDTKGRFRLVEFKQW